MKAKHLLMALALPVAFAACTDEDFVSEGSGSNLAGRKVVGNVTFTSPVDSRIVQDGTGLKWTQDDVLGAALMDELVQNPTDANPVLNYSIVNRMYSNYKYTVDENGYFTNNNALLVEGNYFVYAQYNKDHKRTGLTYSIDATQQSGEAGRDAWYKNQMFLDHIFVTQGNLAPELDMKAVFARAALMLKYEGTDNTLVINKVVITDTQSGFGTSGAFMPAETATYAAFASEDIEVIDSEDYNASNYSADGNMAAVMNAYKNALADLDVTYKLKEGKSLKSPILKEFFDAETVPSMTMEFSKPAATANAYMIIPFAETRNKANLKIEIYTNRGMVTLGGTQSLMSEAMDYDGSYNVIGGDGQTTNHKGQQYTNPTGENPTALAKAKGDIAFNDGINNAFVVGLAADEMAVVSINFKDNAVMVPYELTVTSTEELEMYLREWYSGKKNKVVGVPNAADNSVRDNLVKIIAAPAEGKTVEISKNVMEFIANTTANPVLTFAGDIVIPADADATVLNSIKKAEGSDVELNVTNYATQNWTATGEFDAFVNKGTLTVANTDAAVYTVNEALVNEGTLTINKSLEGADAVYNVGTLVLNAGLSELLNGVADAEFEDEDIVATATVALNNGIEVETLTNYAIVNVANGTVEELSNNATVNVNGTLNVSGESENYAAITVAKAGVLNVTSEFENAEEATITVNGRLDVNTTNGLFKNYGKMVNNGDISCDIAVSRFSNYKDMEANSNSITLISENNQGAEIIVADNTATLNIPNAEQSLGKVTYIVDEQNDLTSIPACANSLRITASSINLKELDVTEDLIDNKYVEFRSQSPMVITCDNEEELIFQNVKFNANGAASEINFTVNGLLTAAAEGVVEPTFEVTENAKVIVNSIVKYEGKAYNFNNEGSIYVIGRLKFPNIIEPSTEGMAFMGYVRGTGSSESGQSNIDWAENGTTSNEAIVGAESELTNAISNSTIITLACDLTLNNKLTLDSHEFKGNGKTLKNTNRRMISIKNGKIENLVIEGENIVPADGCKRGIFNDDNRTTGELVIDNVKIQGVGYALNLYGNTGSSFVVKNSTLVGWTSFTGYTSSNFENCHFGNGAYFSEMPSDGNLKPHNDVVLTNCTFDKGFCLDFEKNPSITLKNCKVNGVVITAANIKTLLGSANDNDELELVQFN